MSRTLFGTDGVRGLAGKYPLDQDGCRRIGQTVGSYFAGDGGQVVVGWDTRESSDEIVKDLTAGLNAAGVEVVLAGVLPTPGLAYAARENPVFKAGIMVTASHNPYQYNGIKVFDANGDKLTDEIETKLNKLIDDAPAPAGQSGSVRQEGSLAKSYEDFLVASAEGLDLAGFPIAVDAANGAAAGLAARVFERLGAKVTALSDQPDGRNINAGCGATDTSKLRQTVQDQQLALGIALDGDADRLIMSDNLGREVKGDYLLYILAVSAGLQEVVATVMSNLGFELALQEHGIKLRRTDVGDRYVLEALLRDNLKLGGEQSGHVILPDLLKTGDGLLAAVQTLKALRASDKTLAQWCDEVELLPQALVNVPLDDKSLLDKPEVKAFVAAETDRLSGKGRLLIRPSGTEPLARVMVEAPDAEAVANQLAGQLKELLRNA